MVQALLTVWVLALVLRAHGLGGAACAARHRRPRCRSPPRCPGSPACCSPTSSSGLAVLALYLVSLRADALARWERVALIALIAFAAATHSATLAVLLPAGRRGLLVALFDRRRVPFARRRARLRRARARRRAAGRGQLTWSRAGSPGRRAASRIPLRPHAATTASSRAISPSIAPTRGFKLCDHRASCRPTPTCSSGARACSTGSAASRAWTTEMRTIVRRKPRSPIPGMQLKAAVAATAEQLVQRRDRLRHQYRDLAHLRHDRDTSRRRCCRP